jgi:hypothetical protein
MAPGQAVKTRLELFQGEWFLDNSVGTPYLTNVLGKHSQQMADAAIKDVVNNTQGITAISQFVSAMNSQTRYYSVQMVVQTIYGPTPVQMANYQNY